MKVIEAPDIQDKIIDIVRTLDMAHIDSTRVRCVRSSGATSRATARIYEFSQALQVALGIDPVYVIEVLSEKFDRLANEEKDKVLIHELLHIPKTFSGALVSHTARVFDGKGGHKTVRIDNVAVKTLHNEYKKRKGIKVGFFDQFF